MTVCVEKPPLRAGGFFVSSRQVAYILECWREDGPGSAVTLRVPAEQEGLDMAERTCTIEECDRRHAARGWCSIHYGRWLRTGDPTIVRTPTIVRRRPVGARTVTANGYVVVKIADDDPLATMAHQGWISEHRLVIARSLGRPLSANELVHHVNNDPSDNRLVNLELWTSFRAKAGHPNGRRAADPHCRTCRCNA